MRHLLLEGASGIGKSTAILEELSDILYRAGGFATKRVYDSDNNFRGFCQLKAKNMDGLIGDYLEEAKGLIISVDEHGRYHRHLSVFKEFTVKTFNEAADFFLLDEIAGFELTDDEIFKEFIDVFNKGIPCIGVFKAEKNISDTQRENTVFMERYSEYRKALETMDNLIILDVDKYGIEEAKSLIRAWILENL